MQLDYEGRDRAWSAGISELDELEMQEEYEEESGEEEDEEGKEHDQRQHASENMASDQPEDLDSGTATFMHMSRKTMRQKKEIACRKRMYPVNGQPSFAF
ncbi:hypothetical protein T440DRAFT_470609 [Plenodomus tracheiphilus IPT5]|uniref:Uncharacterized protein n=1 Tax=Plenodomus tracheiphilus IPT5 TaxID=1408161 RepID=A0A6A7AY24_9PLEO|nr:hypothetical protein T440DRAFT_470609 [Plenodomus tracheiphilus IPT5]